jgi:hypothetical protein
MGIPISILCMCGSPISRRAPKAHLTSQFSAHFDMTSLLFHILDVGSVVFTHPHSHSIGVGLRLTIAACESVREAATGASHLRERECRNPQMQSDMSARRWLCMVIWENYWNRQLHACTNPMMRSHRWPCGQSYSSVFLGGHLERIWDLREKMDDCIAQ